MHWTEELFIGLIVLAFVAVIVGSKKTSGMITALGQAVAQLANNVTGT